jgi:hypothetical protein
VRPADAGRGRPQRRRRASAREALDGGGPPGAWWLATGVSEFTSIDGEVLPWSRRLIWGDRLLYGNALYVHEPAWDSTVVWGNLDPAGSSSGLWGNSVR